MSSRIDPVSWCKVRLRLTGERKLYDWQNFVLWDVLKLGRPTSVRVCNGGGKTSRLVAPAALYMAEEFPGSTTVITTATARQLRDQVFKSLNEFQSYFPHWTFDQNRITTPNGSRIIGFSTDTGGRFEGYHGSDDKPLFIIVDEAKSIRDYIFEAIDRCAPQYRLYVSSPGGCMGRFYDSFFDGVTATHAVGYQDCPHISSDYAQQMAERYGADSATYRSMMLGEFTGEDIDGGVIQFSWLERCYKDKPPHIDMEPLAFCDAALTTDENVIAVARGNLVTLEDVWVGDGDKDRITMRFKRNFQRLRLKSERIMFDPHGDPAYVLGALRADGWEVHEFQNRNYPTDNRYFNPAAEAWEWAARCIADCAVILPDDPILKQQLLSRRWKPRADGRLQLEPKKEMREDSPDRAEAVVGVLWLKKILTINPNFNRPSIGALLDELNEHQRGGGLMASVSY